tara:strand:+ start:800 stop:973 length:174 start_codon:yes stop_codon:yes gene_type:complete
MSSVTEQMLLHAQEFNTRLDITGKLMLELHQEVMQKLLDVQDRLDLVEIRLKELNRG